MCGIIGCVGAPEAPTVLYEGLRRLEYRGYDSAGLAIGHEETLHVEKTAGRVDALDPHALPSSTFGIAHTRWATHGPPTHANAHPHTGCQDQLAVAHNGILENHDALREELRDRGHTFTSDTDTEVLAHLLEEAYEDDIGHALHRVTPQLAGSYAILAAHANEPDTVAAASQRSPLVAGIATDSLYLASDVVAFRPHTDRVLYLQDGDIARISPQGLDLHTAQGRTPSVDQVSWELEEATKSGFPHFMLKEIHEQPRALREALMGRTSPGKLTLDTASDPGTTLPLARLADKDELAFVACGSSYNAARAARRAFETLAGVPTRVARASEFTPREHLVDRAAVVAVTQSGETADTLRALEAANRTGIDTLAVTNTNGSTATRTADAWFPIRAGPEISVAATKTFTSQLMALRLLAAHLAHARSTTSPPPDTLDGLQDVPSLVERRLDRLDRAREVGHRLATDAGSGSSILVLGTGPQRAVAEEIALKVKEISYLHAESFAMGELKHGPLALVEEDTPLIALDAPHAASEGIRSSLQEAAARGAHVTAISHEPGPFREAGFETLATSGDSHAFDFEATLLGQIIAYEAAVQRGCNVDKPRNLAKSVTVE